MKYSINSKVMGCGTMVLNMTYKKGVNQGYLVII